MHALYALHSEDLERDLYAIQEVAGFFGSEDEYATFRAPRSRRLVEAPVPSAHETLELRVLGRAGQPVAAYTIGGADIVEETESDGLVDLRITGYLWDTPRPATDEVWNRWRQSKGIERGAWSEFSEEGREAWLDAARLCSVWRYPLAVAADSPEEFELDGSHVTDRAGLYCALGEALNGPGGYYGASVDALKDCLRGDFGPVAPFTLTWHHSATARAHVPETLDDVLRVLHAAGVTMRLR
ncbi:barstar family protein [Streptomyces axinellae]|uniref:Barstar (barnase inhibitor) domain-containing protein n=1 Tax=Streptomyces axinellae TaxID=552788 RepID=A0ABN3QWA2_9ACTN